MAKLIADLLLIGVITFVGYSILIGFERKQIANMVLVVSIMLGLLTAMNDLGPVIEKWNARLNSLQDTADRVANIGQGSWEMPMKGAITQNYDGITHHGIDIAAPEGTVVSSTRKGEVTSVGWSDVYGNVIVISHGRGMQSLYGHLSGLSVKVGYPVIAGAKIGTCGSTGNSTGPHLHFEIRKNGTCVDPSSYL
ncbi:M23 family metallopeptidase [Desulfosporosinus sp. OT]|uniref:M23 family metallopeptidase n=1 Tax=Desulfosporosinus sp. OT TaxID=913865 RepID=UPI000223A50C|nr:M23 family metallopeptidase [Desulfosporosinus sp. OT]EGW36436.1 peptidase M23 family protein [Desulfosporosinus sp. OT]